MNEKNSQSVLEDVPSHSKELPGEKTPRFRSGWLWLLILVLLGLGVYFVWVRKNPVADRSYSFGSCRHDSERPCHIPVVAAKTRKGDIGVYFPGLGAVTPIYTVAVKSRVDGQLMKILYKEGDLVHEGDLLVEIDPRPYQVQLTQAEGQLLKDQAALDNARIDLARYQTLLTQTGDSGATTGDAESTCRAVRGGHQDRSGAD